MLEARDISFRYGRSNPVLHSVDLSITQATIVGLIGPNGSGKTTLIDLVCDVLALQSGSITMLGEKHTHAAAKTAIMHVGGNDDVPSFLTGWEYVSTLARLYGVRVRRVAVAGMFSRFGMAGAEERLIDSYSHGMKKKMQLCCAFLLQRPLTIVDETLNGVDIDAWYLCVEQFCHMRDQGLSVLICSHDFALLERLADGIVLLRNGRASVPLTVEGIADGYGGIAAWYRDWSVEAES